MNDINVLIVDDEASAIEAVRNGILWEELGFVKVLTATSMQEAKIQMDNNQIDILMSDIEMPQGSGLELLKWTNAHFPNVKCLFMTCHADFNFLQQAMQMGSVDYILKPLDFIKVTQVIKVTMDKIITERNLKENSNSWLNNKNILVKQFWKDYFLAEISPNEESLVNYFRLKRLGINLNADYLPILIVTKKWTVPANKKGQKLLQYALRNITEEVLVISKTKKEVLTFSDNSILVMLEIDNDLQESKLLNDIEISCRVLAKAAQKYAKEIICCYIGKKDSIYEMPSIIELLQEMDFNNVIHEAEVFLLDYIHQKNNIAYNNALIKKWCEWVEQGRYKQVIEEITNWLVAYKRNVNINRDFLEKFTRDFYVLIYDFAKRHNVFINELFGDDQSVHFMGDAWESLEGLLQWVQHAIGVMENFDKTNINRNNPVSRTKDFIEQHLSEEISMELISKNVHLNADYLTRIFKKEVGVSISKYLIIKKIEKAKNLLIYTEKSIGEIAMLIGYYNYSSFNRIFTKETGMSPQEFKRTYSKNTSNNQ